MRRPAVLAAALVTASPGVRARRGRSVVRTGAVLALVAMPLVAPAARCALPDSARYAVAVTDIHRVGLTVTNYGFFGNNLVSRSPSFEFPLGSGYEHMSRAGLWVGAVALSDTGLFTGVSAAIVDNVQGSNAAAETEFAPTGLAIERLSRIANNRFYSPRALSDQDFVCEYVDQPAREPSGYQSERHTPLGIRVHQRTLAFSLETADAFVVAQFSIVNEGPPLRDVYVGLYAQLVSGDRNAYSSWPPSSTQGPGSWYYKTWVEYDAERRLYKERYCLQPPYPSGCDVPYCPPWAGVKLLGVHPAPEDTMRRVGFHWWSFSPGDTLRDTDVERYALLADPGVLDTSPCVPGAGCSPIMLLSVGPFRQLDPGDTVRVDFAFVGGEDEPRLLEHADYAQFAYGLDYRLPAPPPSPRLHVETGDGRVDLYWDDSPESAVDPTSPAPGGRDFEGYRVYLSLDRQRLERVAQFDLVDSTGFNTGLESLRLDPPRVVDGVTYHYRHSVRALRDGFPYWGAVTSYDLGDAQIGPLESGVGQNKFLAVPNPAPDERRGVTVYPNPYRVEARWDQGAMVRDHWLWFANLPRRGTLRIYTLAGERVFETRLDGATYRGENARGLYDPRADLDTPPPALSGAAFAWNLISEEGQAIASGLYLYAVEDADSGRIERGKFLVVKSDREP